MTTEEFRALALSIDDAVEGGHRGHPDFRRAGRVFATLGYPSDEYGMLKLTPEEQRVMMAADPTIFSAAAGAWGRAGSTLVHLPAANARLVGRAFALAAQPEVRATPRAPRKPPSRRRPS